MYLDTYLNTVTCKRETMSSMKADTCDQEHHTEPATPVDGVPTTTTATGWIKAWLLWVISEYFHQSDQKKTYVLINPFQKYICK